jgi:predicted O-methyltransferase YrrM
MLAKFKRLSDLLGFYINAKNFRNLNDEFLAAFVYDILEAKPGNPILEKIEHQRKVILRNKYRIEFTQFGAGDASSGSKRVNQLATTSLSPQWKCQVLYNLASKSIRGSILELGTSFGISTAYLAVSRQENTVFTVEGSKSVHDLANSFFEIMALKNIKTIYGDFNTVLPDLLDKIPEIGLAYIDGNHRKNATLEYFASIVEKCHAKSFVVIDDIYWSEEMKEAWAEIKNNPKISATVDLFQMGIAMLNPALKGHHRIIKWRFKPLS